MSTKFLDDLEPGDKFVTGGITLSESEIIAFALTRSDVRGAHEAREIVHEIDADSH